MPLIPQFEHNGVSIERTEPPAPMGAIGANVVGLVGTAPNKHASVAFNVPFRIANPTDAAKLDTTGDEEGTLWHTVTQTLKKVQVPIYVVVVQEGESEAATLANIIGGVDVTSGQPTGLAVLPLCTEVPNIIAAPGFSDKLALASALASLGRRIMARVVLDAPDVKIEDVIAYSQTIGGEGLGYEGCYLAYPMAAIYSKAALGDIFVPPSTLAIGALAAVKPWQSPGNQGVYAQDVARAIDYNILDKTTNGDLLNKNGVSYFARTSMGGFSLIGNRAVTGEFISHTGLADEIARKLVGSAQKAMAKNLTKSFMDQEVKRLDDFLQTLVADETIPGGRIYLHPDLNSVEKYKNGTWYVVIEYGRYSPNEHMIYQLNASDAILEAFLEDVL